MVCIHSIGWLFIYAHRNQNEILTVHVLFVHSLQKFGFLVVTVGNQTLIIHIFPSGHMMLK